MSDSNFEDTQLYFTIILPPNFQVNLSVNIAVDGNTKEYPENKNIDFGENITSN